MPNPLEQVKQFGSIFAKGLMPQLIPGMAAGLIVNLFHEWNIDLEKVAGDIQNNRSLWNNLTEEQRRQLAMAAKRAGTIDFITPEFIIDAIKEDFPTVASLFANWKMAAEWLDRQIVELKGGINSININNGNKNSK
jgi:hypothetical protein